MHCNFICGLSDVMIKTFHQSVSPYGYKRPIKLCLLYEQDDVVMGTLTVRENLMFSANLRFPQTMSDEEKLDRVDEAIEELGLANCADTKVGIMRHIEPYVSVCLSIASRSSVDIEMTKGIELVFGKEAFFNLFYTEYKGNSSISKIRALPSGTLFQT